MAECEDVVSSIFPGEAWIEWIGRFGDINSALPGVCLLFHSSFINAAHSISNQSNQINTPLHKASQLNPISNQPTTLTYRST
jgi:hypothetical protein